MFSCSDCINHSFHSSGICFCEEEIIEHSDYCEIVTECDNLDAEICEEFYPK